MPYTAKQVAAAHEVVAGRSNAIPLGFAKRVIREQAGHKERPPAKSPSQKPQGAKKGKGRGKWPFPLF